MPPTRPFPPSAPSPCYIDSPFRQAETKQLAGEGGTIVWAGKTHRRGALHRQGCHDLYLCTDS